MLPSRYSARAPRIAVPMMSISTPPQPRTFSNIIAHHSSLGQTLAAVQSMHPPSFPAAPSESFFSHRDKPTDPNNVQSRHIRAYLRYSTPFHFHFSHIFFLLFRHPPRSTLFPYTTLFR